MWTLLITSIQSYKRNDHQFVGCEKSSQGEFVKLTKCYFSKKEKNAKTKWVETGEGRENKNFNTMQSLVHKKCVCVFLIVLGLKKGRRKEVCVRERERNISKINGAILVIKYSCAGEVFTAYLKSVGE